MKIPDTPIDLSGKLLIAMPGMGDPRFEKAVIYVCVHSADGAMGLIVNKPTPDVRLFDLLDQLKIPQGDPACDIRVHFGGPVEHGRGFVLHTADFVSETDTTLLVDDTFAMTATLDILQAIAQGRGPSESLLALGYAGWAPGQLEDEIARNGWLSCDARPEIVFARNDDGKWMGALHELGVDPLLLSGTAGRA